MREEERDRLVEWLLAHAGPVVRFRTAMELLPDCPPVELNHITHELLACPLVVEQLSRLSPASLTSLLDALNVATLSRLAPLVHGSKAHQLENVLGRVNELGLRAGLAPLDAGMLPLERIFRAKESWRVEDLYSSAWSGLVKSIFAWGLLRAGYVPNLKMQAYLSSFIDNVYRIAKDGVYDLYMADNEKRSLPKAWAGKPVLRREIMAEYHLPLIHDLYVLAYFPDWMMDGEVQAKMDRIVSYVLDPRFQALSPGYGYAWIAPRRACYSWGWSPHLAGFHGFAWKKDSDAAGLVQQVELMVRFPAAHRTRWFQSALRHLEWYRTASGTYCFPAHYLRDLPDGYYVSGARMGLGENRRPGRRGGHGVEQWLEIESTFRMLKIRLALPEDMDPILL